MSDSKTPFMDAGGFKWSELNDQNGAGSVTGALGQYWNNLSGTTANNMFSASEAEKARVFNSAEAQKARDFEEYMSNTAYQRATADMKAAGLNPAAIGGNAASTPSGQAASASAARAVGGSSGGFASLIAGIAKVALGEALHAKFSNSAEKAADNHELVSAKISHMAQQELSSAKKADAAFKHAEAAAKNANTKAMNSALGRSYFRNKTLDMNDLSALYDLAS